MPHLSKDQIEALPTPDLEAVVNSTSPDGRYGKEFILARDELARRLLNGLNYKDDERRGFKPVDWSKPIEAKPRENGLAPRPARVLGEHKGAIEFVDVRIEGDDFFDPPGDYAACKVSGFIRGKLAVRNGG